MNLPPGTLRIKKVNSFGFSFCGALANEYDLGLSKPSMDNSAHIPGRAECSTSSSVSITTFIMSLVNISKCLTIASDFLGGTLTMLPRSTSITESIVNLD